MRLIVSLIMLFISFIHQASSQTSPTRYVAPDRAFSISVPAGWKVEREKRETGWITMISNDGQPAAKLVILTDSVEIPMTASAELKSKFLVDISAPYFKGWIDALREQARVGEVGKPYRASVNGIDAQRLELSYSRGDQYDPRKGSAIFLFGRKTSFFVTLTGSRTVFPDLEKVFASWQAEPSS